MVFFPGKKGYFYYFYQGYQCAHIPQYKLWHKAWNSHNKILHIVARYIFDPKVQGCSVPFRKDQKIMKLYVSKEDLENYQENDGLADFTIKNYSQLSDEWDNYMWDSPYNACFNIWLDSNFVRVEPYKNGWITMGLPCNDFLVPMDLSV